MQNATPVAAEIAAEIAPLDEAVEIRTQPFEIGRRKRRVAHCDDPHAELGQQGNGALDIRRHPVGLVQVEDAEHPAIVLGELLDRDHVAFAGEAGLRQPVFDDEAGHQYGPDHQLHQRQEDLVLEEVEKAQGSPVS